jgi:uncharacterized protein with NRDE domain
MCLVAWSIAQNERFPFVLISNRDEFFDRPSLPLAWWRESAGQPLLLSGRDLSAGGTWLGLNPGGRLALVTNVREPQPADPGARSRGELVPLALQAPAADETWLAATAALPRNGFNLVVANLAGNSLHWVSNRAPGPRAVGGGVQGLSNAALDTPWPKVQGLKQRLGAALQASADLPGLLAASWAALANRQAAPEADLPRTGLPLERERQLSSAFIHVPASAAGGRAYGTRCSTVVVVERHAQHRQVLVLERSFDAAGQVTAEVSERFALA